MHIINNCLNYVFKYNDMTTLMIFNHYYIFKEKIMKQTFYKTTKEVHLSSNTQKF